MNVVISKLRAYAKWRKNMKQSRFDALPLFYHRFMLYFKSACLVLAMGAIASPFAEFIKILNTESFSGLISVSGLIIMVVFLVFGIFVSELGLQYSKHKKVLVDAGMQSINCNTSVED